MSKKSLNRPTENGCRYLFVLLALLLFGFIVGYLLAERRFGNNELPTDLCMTSGCVNVADVILQSLNRSVDPCEDFYTYTCGNFKHSKLVPLTKSVWGAQLEEERIRNYFLSVLKSKAETDKVLSQAKLFHDKCMNYSGKTEAFHDEIIYDILNRIGHYPELGINLRNFDLTDALIAFNGLNIFVLLDLEGVYEPVIRFNGSVAPALTYIRTIFRDYNETLLLKHHRSIVAKVMNLFNMTMSDLDMPALEKIANSLLRFHKTTIEKLPKSIGRPEMLNFTVAEIQKAIPMINITRYLMSQSYPETTLKINDNSVIPSLLSLEGLVQINKVLEDAGADVLRHFLLDILWGHLDEENISTPSETSCYSRLQHFFVAPVSGLFGSLFTKPEEKAVAKEMADDIHETAIEILQESDWMDEKTREYAADKARKMSECIAYPDEFLDPKKTTKGFEYLDLRKDDKYVEMVRKLNQMKAYMVYKTAFRPVDRSFLCTTIKTTILNAYYYREWNSFVILSRILQEPFFDYTFPKMYLYAIIGSVVGHEIMHGFDSRGRNYDSDGQITDWWSKASRAEYDKRKDCFINQYNNMTSDGFRENGNNSITENIADNAGLSLSIRAIKRAMERNPDNRVVLPGLQNFTPEQTFFLSFGQLWCAVSTKERMEEQLKDSHAFLRNRINGPVTNHKEFAEAFQCKPGSKHNPKDEERCVLW